MFLNRLWIVTLLTIAGFAAVVDSGAAQSYGYAREDDPLVTGVKKVIGLARDADWDRATSALEPVEKVAAELRAGLDVDPLPEVRAALAARDAPRVAYALTHVVFQALRLKLRSNLNESLAKHVTARARLDSAQFYYESILSPTVRRADQAQSTDHHRRILEVLRGLRETLGSPGLFGVGEKAPNVELFRELTTTLETELLAVYPNFRGTPDSSAKPPADAPQQPDSRPNQPAGAQRAAGGGRPQ